MGGPFASDPPVISLPARNQTMTVWNAGLAVVVIGFSAVAAGGEDVTLRSTTITLVGKPAAE
jgi:hypothetical protein